MTVCSARLSRRGSRLLLAATALVLAACTRPRVPIVASPTPAPAQRTSRNPSTSSGNSSGSAGSAVPLATAAVLGASAEADIEYVRSRRLQLPVAGIHSDQLADSFDEPRDGTRRHRAIDILAPRGTPVLAADDGHVLRVSWNSAGGNTVYATDVEGRIVYYYAHLDHYRESLAAGMPLAKGDTIGFVGTTGNAPKDIPHLHFQIMRMPHDGKYWNGEPINPFAILRGEAERP
jgi:murein DD-endopeptidase MepM/ murein hydrolase activator NlpD